MIIQQCEEAGLGSGLGPRPADSSANKWSNISYEVQPNVTVAATQRVQKAEVRVLNAVKAVEAAKLTLAMKLSEEKMVAAQVAKVAQMRSVAAAEAAKRAHRAARASETRVMM